MIAPRTGLLLINVGTPASPTASDVRPYLREFLGDPRIIDMPAPLRWMLVNGIIAPFRAPKSAEAYQKIWTDEGSPLLAISEAQAAKVRAILDEDARAAGAPPVQVELAMRYGEPSLARALASLREGRVERLVVFPLYPQYSSPTTASSVERVMELLAKEAALPSLCVVPPFYAHAGYLDAVIAAARPALDEARADHTLFSFHGLPESYLHDTDLGDGRCLSSPSCCDAIVDENRYCYRAQCYATARGLALRLGLDDERWSVSFQSRLGRQEWVKPYTDDTLPELARRGVKRLAVFCPAFVTDCLETLEEIGVRAKEDFVAAGGEGLFLMPCPNTHDAFVDVLVELARAASGWLPPSARESKTTGEPVEVA